MSDASAILVVHEGKLHTLKPGERPYNHLVAALRARDYADSRALRQKEREEAEAKAKKKMEKRAKKKAKKAAAVQADAQRRAAEAAEPSAEPVFATFDIETSDVEDDGFISIVGMTGSDDAPWRVSYVTATANPIEIDDTIKTDAFVKANDCARKHWLDILYTPQAPSEEFLSVDDLPNTRPFASGGYVSSAPSRRPIPERVQRRNLDPKRPIKVGPQVVLAADSLLRLITRNGLEKTAAALGVTVRDLLSAYSGLPENRT